MFGFLSQSGQWVFARMHSCCQWIKMLRLVFADVLILEQIISPALFSAQNKHISIATQWYCKYGNVWKVIGLLVWWPFHFTGSSEPMRGHHLVTLYFHKFLSSHGSLQLTPITVDDSKKPNCISLQTSINIHRTYNFCQYRTIRIRAVSLSKNNAAYCPPIDRNCAPWLV